MKEDKKCQTLGLLFLGELVKDIMLTKDIMLKKDIILIKDTVFIKYCKMRQNLNKIFLKFITLEYLIPTKIKLKES